MKMLTKHQQSETSASIKQKHIINPMFFLLLLSLLLLVSCVVSWFFVKNMQRQNDLMVMHVALEKDVHVFQSEKLEKLKNIKKQLPGNMLDNVLLKLAWTDILLVLADNMTEYIWVTDVIFHNEKQRFVQVTGKQRLVIDVVPPYLEFIHKIKQDERIKKYFHDVVFVDYKTKTNPENHKTLITFRFKLLL